MTHKIRVWYRSTSGDLPSGEILIAARHVAVKTYKRIAGRSEVHRVQLLGHGGGVIFEHNRTGVAPSVMIPPEPDEGPGFDMDQPEGDEFEVLKAAMAASFGGDDGCPF